VFMSPPVSPLRRPRVRAPRGRVLSMPSRVPPEPPPGLRPAGPARPVAGPYAPFPISSRNEESYVKIALIAEHTTPLAAHRGEATCGDSVHIASLSRQLAKLGHRVTVYARKSTEDPAGRSRMGRGVHADILPAGPERPLHAEEEAEHTGASAAALASASEEDAPDVVHALGWTRGLAPLSAVRRARGAGLRLALRPGRAAGGARRRARRGPADRADLPLAQRRRAALRPARAAGPGPDGGGHRGPRRRGRRRLRRPPLRAGPDG